MSSSTVKAIPDGMHSLTPHLICEGADEAIAFYTKALGATLLSRLPGPDGKVMHAAMRIGDSVFMLGEACPAWGVVGPKTLKGTTVNVHIYSEHVDADFDRAVAAGAKVIMPPTDMFWGDRYCQLEDLCGHRWSIATHTRDLTDAQIQEEMKRAMENCATKAPPQ